ncbi:hypothetical protein CBR_g57848 [Chara braunii]|uniref:Endonuclease/exonuclease/phosphatase domain-containing protein n=1 Tax=Chara braunii TaxID=69332 RepID=A0A388K8B5_CHABU|nr:hypothetical protein CBR_g57848 [Chara braunii]|eukprot:GBG66246.1 hypothetical protein CBR_g57848 [Chara braunii]
MQLAVVASLSRLSGLSSLSLAHSVVPSGRGTTSVRNLFAVCRRTPLFLRPTTCSRRPDQHIRPLCLCRTRSSVPAKQGQMTRGSQPPLYRHDFVAVCDDNGSPLPDGGSQGLAVRVISYNVLAQALVKSEFFPHSPRGCLRWKERSKALAEELVNLQADFLCLQELDEFKTFYEPLMKNQGYASLYQKRPGRKRDGSCIFFRESRFELLESGAIDYNDLVPAGMIPAGHLEGTLTRRDWDSALGKAGQHTESVALGGQAGDDSLKSPSATTATTFGIEKDGRIKLLRDCVGVLGVFQAKDRPGDCFIVASTQLYWDPEWKDVKMAQARYLVKRLTALRQSAINSYRGTLPILLGGDFNSTPGDEVYNYLTSVPDCSLNLPSVSGTMEVVPRESSSLDDPASTAAAAAAAAGTVAASALADTETNATATEVISPSNDLACSLSDKDPAIANTSSGGVISNCEISRQVMMGKLFVSSYASASSEPPFTTICPKFTGTLDYVFLSPPPLARIRRLLRVPETPDEATVIGGVPNTFHPSDHLPVGVDVILFPRKQPGN